MRKKVFSLFTLLLILCFALTSLIGCTADTDRSSNLESNNVAADDQSTDSSTEEQAEDSTSDGEIGGSLVIWEHTPQFEAPLKAVIEGFNELYPNVETEYEIKTSDQYYNLLATTIQAGETPDLFWTNGTATSNLPSYVAQGVVMDLTDKVDFSLFTDKILEIATIDGRIYASPTAEVGGRAVFYNKDIFEEQGIEIPTTFSEFEAVLEQLNNAGILPISFAAADPWCILFHFEPVLAAMSLDWLHESETGIVKVNDPRVNAAYNKMLEWADKGYYGPGYMGVDGGGALLAFSKGEAAMTIDGTWNVQTIQENNPDLNFGAFHLPTEDGIHPFVGTSSCGFSASAETENPKAALAFLNFFASAEGQALWVNTLNAVPGVNEVQANDPVIAEISDFDEMVASYYDILGKQEAEGENPRKVWEEDQTKVMAKGITPEEFTDNLQSMMTEE